ncbi:MAG: hypothetical protein WCL24_13285 [Verrucomicrobiota bacterium]
MTFTEVNQHPVVREAEFKRLLGVPPDFAFTPLLAENAAWARAWYAAHGRPWLWARPAGSCAVTGEVVTLDAQDLTSRELARRFRAADRAVVVAASAGAEAEAEAARCWENDEPDRYFFMETYASAVVEALIAEAGARLCSWADGLGAVLLPHYSPGYPGWSVGEQARVFSLLTATGEPPGPLEVMASGMLRPKKSQLAVFALAPAGSVGAAPADLVPCHACALRHCAFRRAASAVAP